MTNPEISQDQMAALELQIRNALSVIRDGQWFTVDRLIETMDIDSISEEKEPLAEIIRDRLIKWNWYRSDRGWNGPSFVRRNHETLPKMIRPIGGRMFGTRGSWPRYGDPSIRRRSLRASTSGSNAPGVH